MDLAVDLVNRRPTTLADLVERCRAAGLAIEVEPTESQLPELLEFLDAWCDVVDAHSPHRRAELLNEMLAESSSHPRLTDHTGGWHVHYRDDGIPLARQLRALISVGTALHLTGRGMHRLGRCAAEDCSHVFADTSRTGRRRYCSTACSNRDAVRRHRARTASTGCRLA